MTAATDESAVRARLQAAPRRERAIPVATLACAVALAAGFAQRDEMWLMAERGPGYALGIAGLACMGALLLYSVRKRVRWLRGRLPLRVWFRTHMVLGIVGPTAILLHANFRLGSLNSRVALASMLGVAASGYLGRFVYARIHRGLYGQRRQLDELRREAEDGFGAVEAVARVAPAVGERLAAFEAWAVEPPLGPARGLWRFLAVGPRCRLLQRRCDRALRASAAPNRAFLQSLLDEHLHAVRSVAQFGAWERIFSVWHAIHLPLCFLLFGAAAAHVLAVHMY